MSNKSRLQTNNTNLQALINKANALPDAGGSGGGSVETCNLIVMRGANSKIAYTSVDENNSIITATQESGVLLNAISVCGSFFTIYSSILDYSSSNMSIHCIGCTIIYSGEGILIAKITASENEDVQLMVNLVG